MSHACFTGAAEEIFTMSQSSFSACSDLDVNKKETMILGEPVARYSAIR